MPSFRFDPYLWIHLAGVAALPIFLELCVLGLGMGDPFLATGLEWLLVGVTGIAPILWMQWKKPFCIFSLVALALKPDQLTEPQRRILRLFKAESGRAVAIAAAVVMALVLWQIYRIAPLVAVPGLPQSRLLGLFIASASFLFANLFLQVPASVLRVLLTSEPQFAAALPYEVGAIAKDFTVVGIRVRRIVPPLTYEENPAVRPTRAARKGSPDQPETDGLSKSQDAASVAAPLVASNVALDASPWDDTWEEEGTPDLTEQVTETLQIHEPSPELPDSDPSSEGATVIEDREHSTAPTNTKGDALEVLEDFPATSTPEIYVSSSDSGGTTPPATQVDPVLYVESSLEAPFIETIITPESDSGFPENGVAPAGGGAEQTEVQTESVSVVSEPDADPSAEHDEMKGEHQNVTGREEG